MSYPGKTALPDGSGVDEEVGNERDRHPLRTLPELHARERPARVVGMIAGGERDKPADEDATRQREYDGNRRVFAEQAGSARLVVYLGAELALAPITALAREPAVQRHASPGEKHPQQILEPEPHDDRARRPAQLE